MSQAEAKIHLEPTDAEMDALRRARYRKAAEMIRRWAEEDPAYNERVGRLLEEELNDGGMRCRENDEPAS